ncbi:MAG: lipocalin-like domain-containing protein [Verrucomicrobiales bacterium]|nr:lipocalin-like domain-containing protein [Verrucomicrobiales bacterium]
MKKSFNLILAILFCLFSKPALADEPAFAFATPDRKLSFPKDHGNHPDFKIEWWYLTGHLFDETDRRFGFEATFFRLAQRPGAPASASLFDDAHIYMAHMAVTNLENQKFYHEERFNREGWNAFSKVGDLDVRNGNWSLKREPSGEMQLEGSIQSKSAFSLNLTPEKPHVIFGENGVSKKGRSESAASYYITWTRLKADGTLKIDGKDLIVKGSAWMDHEISSSQLESDQTGWDWVSVQFEDGRELMAYMLRLKEGGYSAFSKLVWIGKDGKLHHQKTDEFSWKPGGGWKSPETGATYPIRPQFTTRDPDTGEERTFQVSPLMEAQEMSGKLGGVPYWEGACDVIDKSTGKVVGRAYLELAGYVPGLTERLK